VDMTIFEKEYESIMVRDSSFLGSRTLLHVEFPLSLDSLIHFYSFQRRDWFSPPLLNSTFVLPDESNLFPPAFELGFPTFP